MAREPNTWYSLRHTFDVLNGFRLEFSATLLVAAMMAGIEGFVHPLLIKSIFDEGVLRGNFAKFLLFAIAYVVFGLVLNIASWGAAIWSRSLENRIVTIISRQMLHAYYEKEYQSVLRVGHGYFINRIYGDVQEGLVPLLRLAQTASSQSFLLVSSSLVLIYLSWRAFLILAILIPVAATASFILGKKIQGLTSQEREQEGILLSILTRALGAFRMVNGFQIVLPTVDAFDIRLRDYLHTSYRKYKLTTLFRRLNDGVMVVSDFFSMFVGALFVLRGTLTFGAYLAFVNTFWRAVTTLMQLLNYTVDFQSYAIVIERIRSFLTAFRSPYYRKNQWPSVDNITFSYSDSSVLNGLSLRLTPGERVVVIGPNGSGKTTLANILSGYLAPSHGQVHLPERISSITLPISFPPVKVRQLVNDTELLDAFDLGNDAVLEAFADELSSGQQQKVALSLALSREADLYIIDEPFSNLDPHSKEIALSLLLERTREKTLVVIMHGSEECYPLFDRVIDIRSPATVPT
jgi:ABC-type bacteriocin/lantibiotic exporter with double-glycine peptidase domain